MSAQPQMLDLSIFDSLEHALAQLDPARLYLDALPGLANTSVLTDCTLVAGSDTDESRAMLEGNSGVVVAGAVVSLSVVHEFSGAGAVELKCNGFGVNISINDIEITAINVGKLTNTAA